MSSPAKQTPAKKAGWGSLLSGAVAGLESRLDTILADDNEASAKSRAEGEAVKLARSSPQTNSGGLLPRTDNGVAQGSREASRTRVNDRLAEKLARATAAKTPSQAGSAVPSRVTTPTIPASGRTSGEVSRPSGDITRSDLDVGQPAENTHKEGEQDDGAERKDGDGASTTANGTLLEPEPPASPARVSTDGSLPSIEVTSTTASVRPSLELSNGSTTPPKTAAELESELRQVGIDHAEAEKQRLEEMQTLLEKVDALQSKLQYLAKDTVAAAKEANAASTTGTDAAKLAEKDERIALLMEEGESLSKGELRHLQTIKKLRTKLADDEKASAETKQKLDRSERSAAELRVKLRRTEVAERQASEKTKQIAGIEKQVEELRVDRENAAELIRSLTAQLKEAKDRADRAEREAQTRAAEVDKNKIASLENELEDAQIEKRLAEDRATSEIKKARDEAESHKQRFGVRELELKNEIAGLDSRLEAMRTRAEEASAEGGGGSDGSVKLMRQVETLQSQYSMAKENWETIEGSLNSRLAALEQERDESIRREAEVRKKARDVGMKGRKAEEELDNTTAQMRNVTQELQGLKEEMQGLQTKLEHADSTAADAQAEIERQKQLWEASLAQRVEEERARWQRQPPASGGRNETSRPHSHDVSTVDILPAPRRVGGAGRTATPHDLLPLHSAAAGGTSDTRPSSRRSSYFQNPAAALSHRGPWNAAAVQSPLDRPGASRGESAASLDPSPQPGTPTIEIEQPDFGEYGDSTSPSRTATTINDLVSPTTSTAPAAGPSVQLVERMSAAVRRLESEKAALRDELARLSEQRDSARDQVVGLMREADGSRRSETRATRLAADLAALRARYDASLEMLGEREEEVGELRLDVAELKRIYRELAEEKVGGGGGGGAGVAKGSS